MNINKVLLKQALSLVRNGDYAHPGEAIAIEMAFASITKNPKQQILDIGCGLGGTSAYLQQHNYGQVSGVDIDAATIEYAKKHHPECKFILADAQTISQHIHCTQDVICLFNSFAYFPNQPQALVEFKKVAHSNTKLIIYEYIATPEQVKKTLSVNQDQSILYPIDLTTFSEQLQQCGWKLINTRLLHQEYLRWYETLVHNIVTRKSEIIQLTDTTTYQRAFTVYTNILTDIKNGNLSGAIFIATPNL